MAGMKVDVKWDNDAIRRLLHEDEVPRSIEKAAGRVRDRAKLNLTSAKRIDTGALRNSIESRQMAASQGVWWVVGSELDYSIFQHEGVQGPVLPRRAKVLRFKPKGSNQFVFARSTAGFEGVPYLTDALDSLTLADFT